MCEEPNGCKRKECLPRGGHAEMERKLEGAEQELSVFTPSAVSSRQAPVRKPYHTTPKLVPGFIGRCLRVFQVWWSVQYHCSWKGLDGTGHCGPPA